eukprot:s5569_g1.t8
MSRSCLLIRFSHHQHNVTSLSRLFGSRDLHQCGCCFRRCPSCGCHRRCRPLPGRRAKQMSSALCRCICGTGKKDQFELQPTFSTDFNVDALGDTDEAPFSRPPLTAGRLTFSLLQQPLRGAPMRQGKLWYLSSEDQVDSVHFSLYVNGFSFWHEGAEVAISLSPFVLVRNCKFQSGYNSTLSDIKIFKISLFAYFACTGHEVFRPVSSRARHSACYYFGVRSTDERWAEDERSRWVLDVSRAVRLVTGMQAHSACYYFGVRSTDERWAEDERSRWVLDVSRAVRLVTQSLFPPYRISCDPQQGVKHTATRLMAGYVVHHEDVSTCSVVYCELHAHQGDLARVTMYENDLCQVRVAEIDIYESATCSEKIGINCSCFSVEDHQFSSRTLAERKLWLRAISNVRVKLQNRAPDPTEEELTSFRTAIKEHLSTIRAALEGPGVEEPALSSSGGSLPTAPRQRLGQTMDPLLQRCHAHLPASASEGPARTALACFVADWGILRRIFRGVSQPRRRRVTRGGSSISKAFRSSSTPSRTVLRRGPPAKARWTGSTTARKRPRKRTARTKKALLRPWWPFRQSSGNRRQCDEVHSSSRTAVPLVAKSTLCTVSLRSVRTRPSQAKSMASIYNNFAHVECLGSMLTLRLSNICWSSDLFARASE